MNNNFKKTKRLVSVAMFAALAYGVAAACYFLPKVSGFLSLDIKDAIIVLCSLIFGPLSGLAIAIIVPVLELVTGFSATALYGLIMNILSSVTFALVTGLIYKYKRSFYGAIVALVSGVFSVTAVMLLANLLITPLYLTFMGKEVGVMEVIKAVFTATKNATEGVADTKDAVLQNGNAVIKMIPTILLPFNLTKATLNGAIVLLLYKPLSNVLKATRMIEYELGDKRESKFNSRSLTVTIVAIGIIAAALCIIFFVLK